MSDNPERIGGFYLTNLTELGRGAVRSLLEEKEIELGPEARVMFLVWSDGLFVHTSQKGDKLSDPSVDTQLTSSPDECPVQPFFPLDGALKEAFVLTPLEGLRSRWGTREEVMAFRRSLVERF